MIKNIEEGVIIYSVLIGSRAYGTHTEKSDYDYKHVYLQSSKSLLIDGYKEQLNVSKDEVIYELRKFIDLLKKGNPTVLEMLFVNPEHIMFKHSFFNEIHLNRKFFLTKKCQYSFTGYATSQIKKAKGTNKKMMWNEVKRKTIIDFCFVHLTHGKTMPLSKWIDQRSEEVELSNFGLVKVPNARDCYAVFYSPTFKGLCKENSNNLRLSSVPKNLTYTYIFTLSFNLDSYSSHCKDYKEYQTWLKERNVERYVDIENHDQKIDGKNLQHTVRLLTMASEIVLYNDLIVYRKDAEILKDIRKGKYSLDMIIHHSKSIIDDLNFAYKESNLPNDCDDICNNLFVNIRNKQLLNIL